MANREYLGVLDDVLVRIREHPYANESCITNVLSEELLYASSGLINDGYLVQHPVLSRFLLQNDPGFLDLFHRDRLLVASAIYPPSKSIERRAEAGVVSLQNLVKSRNWPHLAKAIDELPQVRKMQKNSWPSRDLTDGFLNISGRLLELAEQNTMPEGFDILTTGQFIDFLNLFFSAVAEHHEAPRTQWERILTERFDEGSHEFLLMMDLANLIYHLNISMLLGADDASSKILVTRDSPFLEAILAAPTSTTYISLPDVRFTSNPNLSPDQIEAVLQTDELQGFRNANGNVLLDDPHLSEYIERVSEHKLARDILVRPLPLIRVEEKNNARFLKRIQPDSLEGPPHVRLILSRDVCEWHASKARKF